MCSISKLTFTRFNFFKFPLILQNASAIRNQHYMKTRVKKWGKQDNVRSLSLSLTRSHEECKEVLGNRTSFWCTFDNVDRNKRSHDLWLKCFRDINCFIHSNHFDFHDVVHVYDQDFPPWFAFRTYYYNCIIYHPPAPEINDSKLQSTFFIHCVPT